MIRTQVLRTATELERVRVLWTRLAASQNATIFQSFEWNRTAAELFAEREEPHVIVAERDGHAAILPLAIRRDGHAALIGESLFDYRSMISSGDDELEFTILNEGAKLGMQLEITAVHDDFAAQWQGFDLQPFCKAPYVRHRDTSADDLIAAHRRLGRHSRRIHRQGIELRKHDGRERELVRRIYECKSCVEGSLFVDPLRREFMERICADEDVRCEIFTYQTDADLVAAIVTFLWKSVRYFYTVYYDLRWSEFSPGQVLLFEATLESLRAGLDCDYMTGEYPYKMRLATGSAPLYKLQATAEEWAEALRRRRAEVAA